MRYLFLLLFPSFSLFATIDEAVKEFCSQPGLKESIVGIAVKDLYELDATKSFIPESVQKLVTTATALEKLGPSFQFTTKLYRSGRLSQGVLVGDIIVKGDGDPTLGSHRYDTDLLQEWQRALKEHNIHLIKGRIVVDDSCFEKVMAEETWLWEDLGNYYGAGPSGLSYKENMFTLVFEPTKVGELAQVVNGPSHVRSEVRTAKKGTGDRASIFGAEYSKEQIARGTIPLGSPTFSIRGADPNPPMTLGNAFYQLLEDRGMVIACDVVNARKEGDQLLCETLSVPLSELITTMNYHSVNLYADALFKKLGGGSFQGGSKEVKRYLHSLGISHAGLQVKDGSGLSEKNLTTPRQVMQLLHMVKTKPYFPEFIASMPALGKSGSLSSFGKGSEVEGEVIAKSGTSSTGYCLAGYIKGTPFAIMVNHCLVPKSKVKHALVPLLEAMGEAIDRKASQSTHLGSDQN